MQIVEKLLWFALGVVVACSLIALSAPNKLINSAASSEDRKVQVKEQKKARFLVPFECKTYIQRELDKERYEYSLKRIDGYQPAYRNIGAIAEVELGDLEKEVVVNNLLPLTHRCFPVISVGIRLGDPSAGQQLSRVFESAHERNIPLHGVQIKSDMVHIYFSEKYENSF